MELHQEQIDHIRQVWREGINDPNKKVVVMGFEAVKYLPEIADYSGDKMVVVLPSRKMTSEYLDELKKIFGNAD